MDLVEYDILPSGLMRILMGLLWDLMGLTPGI